MSSDEPLALRVLTGTRILEIDWPDGATTALPHALLREACRCADCEAARRRGDPVTAPAGIAIAGIEPYGPNVVRITFDDGHGRGLYPFALLRELATAGRAPAAGAAESPRVGRSRTTAG